MSFSPKKRLDPSRELRRRRLFFVGLAIFVAADIALVAFALNPPVPERATIVTAPSVTPEPSAEPVESAEPTPPVTVVAAVAPTRILVARDGSLAWRATTGPCPGMPALPELTVDAGVTWKPTTATGPTGVFSLQTITIESIDVASMVGQSPVDCSPMFVRTFVAGDNYKEFPADLPGAWYVQPLDRTIIHSPSGDFAAPCVNVLAFAAHDANRAAVLCADQTVHLTTDAAQSWPMSALIPGVMNVAPSTRGYVIASVGAPDCAGVELLALSEGGDEATTDVTRTGCLPTAAVPDSLAGNIALSEAAGALWLWAGDMLSRSGDGGATWQ